MITISGYNIEIWSDNKHTICIGNGDPDDDNGDIVTIGLHQVEQVVEALRAEAARMTADTEDS